MSGLEPLTCSLRVISQALQACAVGCKTLIPRPVSFLCLALRCTVLRSRWCQSGCQERATSDVPPVCSPPLSGLLQILLVWFGSCTQSGYDSR
jgi:hypothetical protein